MAGKSGGRGKYDIRPELLKANNEYQRLLRAGLPVPPEVAALAREYRRACRRLRDPEAGTRRQPKHDIPEYLRAAANEYNLRWRAGLPIPKEIVLLRRKYDRLRRALRRRAGSSVWPLKRDDISEELREHHRQYRRLKQAGEPIPDDVMAGQRRYDEAVRNRKLAEGGRGAGRID